jgi:uncharacterized protein involved in exopolysaccharide biosynthesis
MGFADLFGVVRLRKLIVLWALGVGVVVGIALAVILPTKYVSSAIVQVDSIQRNSLTGMAEPRFKVAEFLGQQAAIASSRTVALEVINKLTDEGFIAISDFEERWRRETGGELVAGNDARLWAADQLLRDLTVTATDLGSTLEISFRADDPAHAARVANAFASEYMSTVLNQRQNRYASKAASFSDETRALAEDVVAAQSRLADFRAESGILPLGEDRVVAAEVELSSITQRLATARADDAEAQSLLRQAEGMPAPALAHFPVPNDLVSALQAQSRLTELNAALARIKERLGERYPDYVEGLKEKSALEASILQAVRERADYAARRRAALEAESDRLEAVVSELQKTRETYDLLADKVTASQETYNFVTTRSLQESLQSRIDTIDVMLLAKATPPANPATPPAIVIVFIGAIAGAALGASAAVFAELVEARVRGAEAVRQAFRTGIVCEVAPSPQRRARRKRPALHLRRAA